jgi:glycosyltransferase involved in cell wall biosynthesis
MIGGGALRAASVLTYLAQRYEVDVIVFREPDAADPAGAFPPDLVRDVHVIDLPRHSKSAAARAARNIRRALNGISPLNDRFGGFERQAAEFLHGRRYELCVIEHFWCAPYVDQLAACGGRLALDLHNIESVLHERCASAEPRSPVAWLHRRFSAVSRGMERDLLPRFSFVLAASDEDAVQVRRIAPDCRVLVYPNALPRQEKPVCPEEDAIVFSGNLEYHPNVQAVRHFRKRIWPLLRARWPGLVWRLVGKNPDAVRRLVAGDPRIELLGPVPNAVEALAAAKVAVVPLLAGSGTRIKILEAWAAGRAVVSTSLGAEGLRATGGEHLLIADSPSQFAEAVSRALQDEKLRRSLGAAGRALLDAEFTWDAAWAKLESAGL